MADLPELNPVTKKRMIGIAIFLGVDCIVALAVSGQVEPTSWVALPSLVFGIFSGAATATVVALLVVTRKGVESVKRQRVRE